MLFSPARPVRSLLVTLVVMTQVPAVLAFGALAYVQYLRQREAVVDDMVERSRVVAVALRERTDKVQVSLEELAALVPDDPAALRAFHSLARSKLGEAGVDSFALVTPAGQIVLNTRVDWGIPLPRAPAGSLESFVTGTPAVINLTIGAITGRSLAGISVPVLRDSHIPYVLVAGMEPPRFLELLRQQDLPSGWLASIVDSAGAVIAQLPHGEDGSAVVAGIVPPQARARTDSGTVVSSFEVRTLEGLDRVTSARRSPVNGWTVIVSVPTSVLIAPVWRSIAWGAAVFLVLFAGSLSIALLISRRIARSIQRLRDLASALPREPHLKAGEMSFAEGGELANTIIDAGRQVEAARVRVERVTQDFNRTLMREIERRQRRTARELHDSVGSSLAGVSLLLANATERAGDERMKTVLSKAQEQVNRSAQEVREISRGMMPAGTEAGGLVPAIEHLAADLVRFHHIKCVVRARGDFADISAEHGTHLYRITQEACANALRHGGAHSIAIRLVERAGSCRLTIADDGSGCDFASLPPSHPGIGLRSMHARARAIEGHLEVTPGLRRGCRVQVTWKNPRRRPEQLTEPPAAAPVQEVA